MSLKNMTDHIYGRDNMISRTDRPNLFIKELHIYIDFLKNKFENTKQHMSKKEEKYFLTFTNNMKEGVMYYQDLFNNVTNTFKEIKQSVLTDLDNSLSILQNIHLEIEKCSLISVEN